MSAQDDLCQLQGILRGMRNALLRIRDAAPGPDGTCRWCGGKGESVNEHARDCPAGLALGAIRLADGAPAQNDTPVQ